IGKTRLSEEAARRAAADGVAVAWGRCYDGEGSPVLWPWVQVARALLAGTPPESRRAVLGPAASELVPLLPELTDMVPGLAVAAAAGDREAVWVRRYQAFTGLVRRVCADRPLLVVLDDLHWADPPSLRQLVLLAGELTEAPLLMLATYRDVDLDREHPLAEALAGLAREPSLRRIGLTGLSRDDVARVMATKLDLQPDERLATLVHDRTDGNPFFVVELVRLLASEGRLRGPQAEAAVARQVPIGVRDVLRRRLARLPEQTAAVLLVAAVVGRRFALDVVQAATGLDEDAALDAVEAGLVSGLVVEDAETVGSYWFAHALVREAIYEDVSRARRARLHARVGEALRRRYGDADDHRLELAHHWFLAAPAVGAEVALPFVLAAAELATDRFAYDEAERQFARALDLLAATPRSPQRSRTELELHMRFGAMLAQHRGPAAAQARAAFTRARELVDEVADESAVLSALRGLHEAATARAEHRDAREVAERMLEAARLHGQPAHRAAGHLALGRTMFCQGRLEDARTHLERGLYLTASDPSAEGWPIPLPIWGRILLGATLQLLGRTADGAAEVDAAIRQADGRPPIVRATAWGMGSHVAVFARAPTLVRERANAALVLATEGHFVTRSTYARAMLGWVRAVEGDPVGALAPLRQSIADLQASGAQLMMPVLLGLLAETELLAGQPEAALDRLDDVLAGIQRSDERFYEAEYHRLRGETLRALCPPRPADSVDAFHTAVMVARRQGARLLEQRAAASLRAARQALVGHNSRPSQPAPES
ncbi:MAG TPA: AAA family ATPase, partial [Actinomycetes bacterium]